LGAFGVGPVIDAFNMKQLVEEANKPKEPETLKKLSMAYLCWLPIGGIFGLHHYYLCHGPHHFHVSRLVLGLLYTFTFGIFGCGWFYDLFALKYTVSFVNKQIEESLKEKEREEAAQLATHLEEQEHLRAIGRAHRELQEEQDLEFITALSRDQEAERQRQIEVARIAEDHRMAEEERLRREAEEEVQLERKQKKEKETQEIVNRKLQSFPEEPPSGEDIINLVFKMPNGQRLLRRFHKDNKLSLVREWLSLQRMMMAMSAEDFSIETDFPKQVYANFDAPIAQLFPTNQLLLIRDK